MTPLISVILPFHLKENRKYLDRCIQSLARQRGVKAEALIISSESVDQPYAGIVSEGDVAFTMFTMPGESTFSKKMNYGISKADPNSKYIMLLSDDVILGKDALKNMVSILGDQEIILNAMSNCDNGRLNYFAQIPWPQFMKLEELKDPSLVMDYDSYAPVMIPVQSNCFYATMIPRIVWDKVGKLDESYKTGCEDTDYCMRAAKLGIACAVTFNAFIFHFGGATSSKTLTPQETKRNHDLFHMKWGFRLVP